MLSKQNIKRLNRNALYECKPDPKYRGRLFENDLYHCCNWTFEVVVDGDDYYMRDTYWSSGDGLYIKLTDENIDDFEIIFEWDQVKQISSKESKHYEKYYRVSIDSGGRTRPKYFIDKDAEKSKKLVLDEINSEISHLEWKLKYLRDEKERIEDGVLNG